MGKHRKTRKTEKNRGKHRKTGKPRRKTWETGEN